MTPPKPELAPEQLRALRRIDNARSLWTVCWILLSIPFGFVAIGQFPHPATYVIVFLLIGGLQHHLLILQHETLHYILFTNRKANELVGHLSSWLIGFSMTYRAIHLRHHKVLGEHDDPDLANYVDYPNSLAYVVFDFVKNITGVAAAVQFFGQLGARNLNKDQDWKDEPFDKGLLGIVATQLILWGAVSLYLSWWHYLLLWVLPLVTITKTLAHFRNVVEHARIRDIDDPEISRLRTVVCNPLEAFFFAPMRFNYHAEHHLYTTIPYWQLSKAHGLLKQRPEYDDAVDVQRGYLRFLFSLCR